METPDIGALMKMLGGEADPAALKQMENKARLGRFTFAATQYASTSGCPCDACQFLRKAVDGELTEVRKEAGINADGNHPISREVAPVHPEGEAGDAGGGDVPDRGTTAADRVSP